jgi:VWFA-related protein
MRSSRKTVLVLFATLFGFFTAGFQTTATQGLPGEQRPGPPGTIRVRVGLVPVDVIVTDDRDRPVTDLKQEDFQIYENGRLQEIRHFSIETLTAAAPGPSKPSTIRLVPTLELAPQQASTFLILIGRWPALTQNGANQTMKAVDALIRFVRNDLLPQDKVAVYAYNRATDFTTDHERIAQVLEQYKKVADKVESWLQLNLVGFNALYGAKQLPKSLQPKIDAIFEGAPELASRQVPPGQVTAEGRIISEWDKAAGIILGESSRAAETGMRVAVADQVAASGVTGAQTMQSVLYFDKLEADAITLGLPFDQFIPRAVDLIQDAQNIYTCIEYLRYVEGEKHLLFITEKGLQFPYGDVDYDKDIAGVANDARVAIDTFQTGGLAPTIMPTKGVEVGYSTPPLLLSPSTPLSSWGDTAAIQSARTISALTGGRAAIYQDLDQALDLVNQTTRVEYLLGYYPKDENWNGKYRQIDVKVNRSGLKVLFRRGYFAREKLQPYDRAEFLAYSRISAAVTWTENVDDVPFKLSTSWANDERGQQQVKVDLKINAAKLALGTADNLHTGKLRIAVFYEDSGRHPLGSVWKTMDLKLQEAAYREYMRSGLPCSIQIPTNLKDLYIKAVVYDMQGDKVGSKWVRVEKLKAP